MVIVRIFGGLGNQMFQYALYYALCARGVDAYIDISWYSRNDCHNGYELNRVFDIQGKFANSLDVKRLAENDQNILWKAWHKLIRHKKTFFCKYGIDAIRFFPEVFKLDEIYLSGYWQSEKYFKEYKNDIRKLYSFSPFEDLDNINIANMATTTESVSIHVRRGDYLNEPLLNGICDEQYYVAAIEGIKAMVDNPVFFIFSNDILWCKTHFNQINAVFVENNTGKNSYRDMQLMSLCKHHIIANSSFSWWGAWLGKRETGITVCPREWMHSNDKCADIVCDDWIPI